MTLAEDVVLLAHVNGREPVGTGALDAAVAGAVLVELAVAGRVQIDAPLLRGLTGVAADDRRTTSEALPDTMLRRLVDKGPTDVRQLIGWALGWSTWLRTDLTDRGLLERAPSGRLPRTPSWRTVDTRGTVVLVERLITVVAADGVTTDDRALALVRLTAPCGLYDALVPESRSGIPADRARRVLAMLVATDPVSNGVERVVQERRAAADAAVSVAAL